VQRKTRQRHRGQQDKGRKHIRRDDPGAEQDYGWTASLTISQ